MEEKIQNAAEAGYHLSKYNIFSNLDNGLIGCANLLKRTYSELDPIDVAQLYYLDKIKENDIMLKPFIEQGIVVNFDERELLKTLFLKMDSNIETIKITIAVTMSCNFDCPYCFQFHTNKKMSLKTQNDVIFFIKKILKNLKIKKLEITWYGGEPLLVPDIIKNLSEQIIHITKEYKIIYSSNIITNGYYLTQENIDILEKAKVNNCQITLDGIKENHNLSRPLKNGEPTFDIIINNLRTIKFNGVIKIRHNIYKKNKEDGYELKKIISDLNKESGNNIIYYPAITTNSFIEHKQKEKIEFLNEEESIKVKLYNDISCFSEKKYLFCGVQTLGCFCIDTEGLLYKCWEDIDKKERSFGNIEKWNFFLPFETTDNLDMLTKYLNSMGIIKDTECYECIWLPLCMGGCPNQCIFHKKQCLEYKNNPDIFIKELSKKYENEYKTN